MNRYLRGNYAPVEEELTARDLRVTGEIPGFLDGRYVRNGPNPIAPDPDTYHWFAGTGMVHGVRLRDGRAEWYRNRFLRSDEVATAKGEARCRPTRAFELGPNTNVISHAGMTLALVESGIRPFQLTDELDTIGPCDFGGTLPLGYTAHPKLDPVTKELHGISYWYGWGNTVQYSVLDREGRIRKLVDIEVSGSPMMHDFSLTERFVVIYDLPVCFDPVAATQRLPRGVAREVARRSIGRHRLPSRLAVALANHGAGGIFPYGWDPEYPARVGIMPRDGDGDDVRWFPVEPCGVFHPMNAFDVGNSVVVDVPRHPMVFERDLLGPNDGLPTLDRWTFDLSSGLVIEERLDDRGQEWPRIDERLTGSFHRYGYTVEAEMTPAGDVDLGSNTLIKQDVVVRRSETHCFGPDRYAGEFVFVPSSPHAAEDEGVLMGFVLDGASQRSNLVLLDAETLDEVATVHLPGRVPNGFHGNWLPTTYNA